MNRAREGAIALENLIRRIVQVGDETCDLYAGIDCDWRTMVELVQAGIVKNLTHQDEEHRVGFARGLTDLLFMQGAGLTCEMKTWDPLRMTAAGFRPAKAVSTAP